MRLFSLAVLSAALFGCGVSSADTSRVQEIKAYLLKVVEAQKRYCAANQTFSLNMKELTDFDDSLGDPPAGYTVKGGGGLAMAFGFEVHATPESSGPHFYVDDSGIVRCSDWGKADRNSKPVD